MNESIEPQKLSKKHYEILINGNAVKILGFLEKQNYVYTNLKGHSLILKTKIRGQEFYSGDEICTIEIDKNNVHTKFHCIRSGLCVANLQEEYIYRILDKEIIN